MASHPTDTAGTRDRLVEAARYLFWEKGYAATGLAEILTRAHANSGSFYHFFDSKDALLRTVLDTYTALLDEHIMAPAHAAAPDPIGRIFALLDGYRQRLIDTGCQYGCPIGRLALEIDPENTPAHTLLARNFTAWKRAVEAHLRAASVPKPDDVATLILTVMEGGVMQSRAYRAIDPYDACVRQLRIHLRALTPTPRASSSNKQRKPAPKRKRSVR